MISFEQERQNEVFHSSVTWIIMWFWRISCGHSLTNMLLLSVFMNKLWVGRAPVHLNNRSFGSLSQEFLSWIQWIGIGVLLLLGMFTEMHVQEVSQL